MTEYIARFSAENNTQDSVNHSRLADYPAAKTGAALRRSAGASGNRLVQRLVPARLGPMGLLVGPAAVLLVWQVASTLGWISPRLLASPLTAVETGIGMLRDGSLEEHLAASALRAYAGLLLGGLVGLVLALLAGLTRWGEAAFDSLIQIKRAIPTLALIPLAILWLGIGDMMKIALIAFSVLIPIYINTHAGLRSIDVRYVELAQTVGLSRTDFIRRVALPGALPGFFTGLRLAVTTCWTSLVVLEQINTTDGIGYVMSRARDLGQTEVIVLGLVFYALLGLVSDALVRAWERKALAYRKVIGS
jgi:sulfonate transport system permease protein